MKICDVSGCGVCVSCNGIPPKRNGYSCGDICRKTVQNIMNHIQDGDLYRFENGKLYRVEIEYDGATTEEECEI